MILLALLLVIVNDLNKDPVDEEALDFEEEKAVETEVIQVKEVYESKPQVPYVENRDLVIGQLAPDFLLSSHEGEDIRLSDYKGQIVLLNFWATWCKFCDKEMPDLQVLNDSYEDVTVLAINVNESLDQVRPYIEEGGYSFDIAMDIESNLVRKYNITAYPTSYFVDQEGVLLGAVQGMMSLSQMEDIIEQIKER